MKRMGLLAVVVVAGALVVSANVWAQLTQTGGGAVTKVSTITIGVGDEDPAETAVAQGKSTTAALAGYTGTLSWNTTCHCNECSGDAKDCSARPVTSGSPNYKPAWKKGTMEYGEDLSWSCMPPASDCYVVITK